MIFLVLAVLVSVFHTALALHHYVNEGTRGAGAWVFGAAILNVVVGWALIVALTLTFLGLLG